MDVSLAVGAAKSEPGKGGSAVLPGFFFGTRDALPLVAMVPFFEDDEDPKKPRPVETQKKREGWQETGETRKDEGRDNHRHVHVRC